MDAIKLIEIIERDEDSYNQLKRDITNPLKMAIELAAFSNSIGGRLIIGVDEDGTINGLTRKDIGRLNQLVSNASTNLIKNPIHPITENINVDGKLVMVITVKEGLDKPYITNDGAIYVKSGSDKRKVTSREEMRRLFAESDLLHAGETPVANSTINDIDRHFFSEFYREAYDRELDEEEKPLRILLNNMNLAKDEQLNLAGLMLFGNHPQQFKPQFIIKAIYFNGIDKTSDSYIDSRDITGRISQQYTDGISFLKRNLRKEQQGQGRNSTGILEIPEIVLEEILVNAIIHRDYFIDAAINLFIFEDRLEIVSPGVLPNHMNEEHARNGLSIQRNPVIQSFISKVSPPVGLPYRGIGSGIQRAYKEYSDIQLINDTVNKRFVVKIARH